jgi:hypothetical protein
MSARAPASSRRLHIAVVSGPHMEPHLVVGLSRRRVVWRLARFVARNAPFLLRPADAQRVAGLLADRDLEGAVRAYFAALGDGAADVRWERQRLVLHSVPLRLRRLEPEPRQPTGAEPLPASPPPLTSRCMRRHPS